MAKVKINDGQYSELQTNIEKALIALEEAKELWGTNFDNLYHNFVTNGFLDKLYSDADSNYHTWSRGLSAVSNVVSGAALGCAIGTAVPGIGNIAGAIIGAVIGAIFGVFSFCKGDPEWITASKEVLIQMLTNCVNGIDDAYIYMVNIEAKLKNSQIALERVRTRINDYNYYGADFSAAASAYDLSVRTSGTDGLTILGVETEVVIDGQTITMDTSEAMSAFYTYAYTVTSSMIAADYLSRQYGYEIDFLELVTNANAFMADTIQSDLYTSEMIQMILPQYTPDERAAYGAASAATGLSESELQAAMGDLAALGVNPLFAGLVGATIIGKIGTGPDGDSTTAPDGGNNTTAPDGGNNTTAPDGGGPGGPGGSHDDTTTTGPEISTPVVPIDPIVETDVPIDQDILVDLGVVTEDGKVDYDKLAMEEYQFETGLEEIEKFRLQIIDDVEAKYASGDFTSLTKQLQEFGYSTAEIATILTSKSMTINAFLDGHTREIVAAKATEMAKADGVEDFKSSYTKNPTTAELGDNSKPLKSLHLNSDNKELCEMENQLDTLEADYRTKVEDANKLLDEAQVNKQSVDALKEKYEKEFGTDTSKWSEAAAKEYDAAIDKYNTSAEAANKAIETANTAKTTYQESRAKFDKACEDYYMSKMIADEESGQTEGGLVIDGTTSVGGSGSENLQGSTGDVITDGGVTINPDGSVSFGDVTTGTDTGTNSSPTINMDGSVSFDASGNVGNTGTTNTPGVDTSSTATGYMSQDDFFASLGLKSNDKGNN